MSVGFHLRQTSAEVQAIMDKVQGLLPGALDSIGIYAKDDSYWAEHSDFVPELGALLIYTDLRKFKLGNGEDSVAELPFVDAALEQAVVAHISDSVRHITKQERQYWNNKSDFSGRYQDLTGRPFVPTKLSDLNSDSGHRTVSDAEKAAWNAKVDQSQIQGFVTKSVDDLLNYYLKSETYTKEEVQQMISAVQGFAFEVVSVLPTASADTMHKIYLVPSQNPQAQNIKDEYITVESSGSYIWEQIGSTSIDLSGYVTTTQLNTALAAYTTSADLATLLSGKQDTIADLSDIRSGAEAGAKAVLYTPQTLTDAQKAQARTNIGADISTLNIPIIPDLGGHNLGTKAQAATALGITEAELDNLMSGAYDRLVFDNVIYADRTEAVHTYQSNVSVSYSYTGGNPLRFVFWTDGLEYFSYAENIVPELSTSIFNDGSSNTKAATPKAVKDYVDEMPIPRSIYLGTFTPTESSSYISLGNAAAAATALSISEAQLEQLYEGGFNKVILRDRVEGKICIGSESLVNSNATGISYEIMSGDVTPYMLEFLYESSTYKYRYYQLQLSDLQDDSTHRLVTDTEKSAWNAKYEKPASGIPASDIASGVIPDVSNFITNSVNDLVNYYLKSETYTRAEVEALIGAINQFHYEIAASTSAVSDPQSNVLYLIGPTGSGSDKYEEYVYPNSTTGWVKIGDTSIDLSGYVTTQALNIALAAYTTTADLTTLLAGKQDKIDSDHKLPYSLISGTPTIPDELADLASDATHRVVTDTQIDAWNAKADTGLSITWSELKSLRDGGNLQPGRKYRITDYVATTVQTDSRSANHPFDIIVEAISTTALSEDAMAALHSGDTYFANSKLNAWELKYCLDNANTRFLWADTTNGKGVVYRLKDEFDNDVPYDFKGIQFKRYVVASVTSSYSAALSDLVGLPIALSGSNSSGLVAGTDFKWYYTFSRLGSDWSTEVTDASFDGFNTHNAVFHTNYTNGEGRPLNDNVFADGEVSYNFMKTFDSATNAGPGNVCISSDFDGDSCMKNTIIGFAANVRTGSQFRYNTILTALRHIDTQSDVEHNTIFIPKDCAFNSIGHYFYYNIIRANQCGRNRVDAYFDYCYVSLTGQCSGNDIGVNNENNTMTGTTVNYLKTGAGVYNLTFTDADVKSCQIDGQFNRNTFSGKFYGCSFRPYISYVSFVGGTGNNIFAGVDVEGSVRGTSSSILQISSSSFLLDAVTGIKRRIKLEGDTNGNLVATWYSAGKRVGITKTASASTWTALPEAYFKPSGGIPESDLESALQSAIDSAIQAPGGYDEAIFELTPDDEFTIKDGGITKTKLASAVQASLDKADDALRSFTTQTLNTTTVPNVTSVGAASTWSFAVGTGDKSTTLIISGGNGTAPTLGQAKTVATGLLSGGGRVAVTNISKNASSAQGGSND